MRKMLLPFLFFLPQLCFPTIVSLGFEPGSLDESSYTIHLYRSMQQIVPKKDVEQSCDFDFLDRATHTEIKFMMFKETDTSTKSKEQVGIWSNMISMNIANDKNAKINIGFFHDTDVKHEFNADSGVNVFISNSRAEFLDGHKYAMANFFYKKGVGIMCEVILFDKIKFVQEKAFDALFHDFIFN